MTSPRLELKIVKTIPLFVILMITVLFSAPCAVAAVNGQDNIWLSRDADNESIVNLYFYWSLTCPHCQDARPHIESLPAIYPWLKLQSREITQHPDNARAYQKMASALGQEARSVPAFFICGQMFVGWDSPQGIGQALVDTATRCRDEGILAQPVQPSGNSLINLPVLGEVDTSSLSLPVFTLIIASLDAFNPCAFFILLFLLSLLVHARSRQRMLLVGLTFIVVSGLIYFLFMAAWLNLFLVVGGLPFMTLAAGFIAIIFGVLNSKDYFFSGKGPTLSIADTAKPGLFKRMASLMSVDHLPTLLAGTFTLAIAVNSYELLCTAGFPIIYTRTLTLHQLSDTRYYLYLALYNIIYIIPLIIIVALFTYTLGSRKLSQNEGRLLKLLSGVMMFLLGVVLIIAPRLLNNLVIGAGLLVLALLLVGIIWLWQKKWSTRHPDN